MASSLASNTSPISESRPKPVCQTLRVVPTCGFIISRGTWLLWFSKSRNLPSFGWDWIGSAVRHSSPQQGWECISMAGNPHYMY